MSLTHHGKSQQVELDPTGVDGEPAARSLGIDEVTRRATVIKCMGRTYTATARDGTVHLQDRTDITRPRPLGTARPASGSWEIHDQRGNRLTRTDDLLDALALLRQHHWPPLDQTASRRAPRLTGPPTDGFRPPVVNLGAATVASDAAARTTGRQ